MRKAVRLAALTSLTTALAAPLAGAQALPPPPYAADQGQYGQAPRQAAPSQGLDRYGGGYSRTAASSYAPPVQGAAQTAATGPRLGWSGKVETQAQAAAPERSGGWASISQRWNAEPPQPGPVRMQAQPPVQPLAPTQAQTLAQGDTPAEMAARMPPPSNPWRPYHPQAAASGAQAAPPPAPTSIYDAAPPAPAPVPQPYQQAQAAAPPNPQGGPRFYSLHKDYGIQPDPIPLPPQFFGPTADLSAPVADPLAKRTVTVNGQTKTVNAPDDQSAQ